MKASHFLLALLAACLAASCGGTGTKTSSDSDISTKTESGPDSILNPEYTIHPDVYRYIIGEVTDTIPSPDLSKIYLLGRSNKTLTTLLTADKTDALATTKKGSDGELSAVILPDNSQLSVGKNGEYFPVQFVVQSDTFTLLVPKSAMLKGYDMVK